MIFISITDDHPLILQGLLHVLAGKPGIEIQSTYTNGQSLLAGLQRQQPDVLLLDVLLEDCTAEDLLPVLTRDCPSMRILALTSIGNIPRVRNLIRLGCLGYLLKNENEETVLQAIQSVYKGIPFLSAMLKEQIEESKFQTKKELPAHGYLLTRREKEILQFIARASSSKEIADELCISLNTVESHRKNLFQKMDVKNVAGLLNKAMALGLIE